MKQHHTHSHKRHITRREKKRLIIAGIVLVLLLLVVPFLLDRLQKSRLSVSPTLTPSSQLTDPAAVEYRGRHYVPRQGIRSYLLMGIDVTGPARKNKGYVGGGQADAQLLLVTDPAANTWQLLQLDRDTMTEIPVLGVLGDEVGTERQQLALAHAYGDGLQQSCRNGVKAVSTLLMDQPIDGYLALNMDAVGVINQAVGGITITVNSDFSRIDPDLPLGQKVVLTDEQAIRYVRTRANVDDQTNESRMARHRALLAEIVEEMEQMDQQDILTIYDAVFDYMVTSLGSQELCDLVEMLQNMQQLPTLTIDGKHQVVGEHMTFEVDADSLTETVLALFYQEM